MSGMGGLGKALVVAGLVLAAVGLLLVLGERFPWLRLGRLPGDVTVERGNFRFSFPIATSIVVSIVLSLLLWLLARRR